MLMLSVGWSALAFVQNSFIQQIQLVISAVSIPAALPKRSSQPSEGSKYGF